MRRQRSSVGMRMLWAGVTNASATGSGSPVDSFTGVCSGSGVGSAEDDILLSLKLLRHYASLPSNGIFRGLMAPCVAENCLISATDRLNLPNKASAKITYQHKNKIFQVLVHLICFKNFQQQTLHGCYNMYLSIWKCQ